MVNIRQLQVFKTLCDELNFTKTAEKLNMTQPAVSHVIGSLEEEFGVRLVDRLNRRIYLTTAGKLFLAKAIRLLDLYDDLRLNFWAEKEQQPLRVGSCLTIANFWLPGIIKEFNETCPHTPLQVVVDSAAHIEKLLEDNEIDLALYEGVVPSQQFYAENFSSYEICYVVSPEHPLAGRKAVPPEEILQQRLLLREEGSAIRNALDSALWVHNLKAEPVWTSVNSQALIQAALYNLGVSVLPEIIVRRELSEGRLVKLDVAAEPMVNSNYILYHPDKYLTRPMRQLIEIIRSSRGKA